MRTLVINYLAFLGVVVSVVCSQLVERPAGTVAASHFYKIGPVENKIKKI